ncbi:MAG TPA: hypothetical protein VHE35_34925, partial [Kofleriaceae bacterium]|nr:hypothetical protein [Kofleriaceae bacterium]
KPLPWEKSETAATTPAPAPTPPAPPPPPPAPSAVLAEQAGATTDVAAGQQGVLEDVVADGTTVAAGDPIAHFAANPALSKRYAASKQKLDVDLPKAIADLSAKRDAAVAAGKADVVKSFQDKIDKQSEVLASLQAEVGSLTQQLDAYAVKAPLAGTVKTTATKGTKVATNEQVIASITAPTVLVGHFTVTSGKTYNPGDEAGVAPKPGAPPVACKVTAAQGTAVTVECPVEPDVGLTAGVQGLLQ